MSRTTVSQSSIPWGLRKIPPFPPIAARLLVLLSNEFVSMNELAEVIGSDPTFSARLLQCVNSAAFALTSPVTNVLQALSILGLDRTRQMTVTLATAIYSAGALRTAELRRCWEHTVATAILADEIAQGYGAFTESAYAAGIMHDVGRLGLLVAYPKEYESIIHDAASQCLDLLDFEREQFGVDHAEAGRLLAERWGLPQDFLIVVGRHHDPVEGAELDLLGIVHVACRLADTLGYEMTKPLVPVDMETVLAELPPRARTRLHDGPEVLRSLVESRIRMYDGVDTQSPGAQPASEAETETEEDSSLDENPVVEPPTRAGSIAIYVAVLAVLAVLALVAFFFSR